MGIDAPLAPGRVALRRHDPCGDESPLVRTTSPIPSGLPGVPVVDPTGQVVGIVTTPAAIESPLALGGSPSANLIRAILTESARSLFDPPRPRIATTREEAIRWTKKAVCLVEAEGVEE